MKTKLVIEIESKDKLMATLEPGATEKDEGETNIAEDFHKEVVEEIKKVITQWAESEIPEGIEDNYIEGYDDAEDYGLKVTIKK